MGSDSLNFVLVLNAEQTWQVLRSKTAVKLPVVSLHDLCLHTLFLHQNTLFYEYQVTVDWRQVYDDQDYPVDQGDKLLWLLHVIHPTY